MAIELQEQYHIGKTLEVYFKREEELGAIAISSEQLQVGSMRITIHGKWKGDREVGIDGSNNRAVLTKENFIETLRAVYGDALAYVQCGSSLKDPRFPPSGAVALTSPDFKKAVGSALDDWFHYEFWIANKEGTYNSTKVSDFPKNGKLRLRIEKMYLKGAEEDIVTAAKSLDEVVNKLAEPIS